MKFTELWFRRLEKELLYKRIVSKNRINILTNKETRTRGGNCSISIHVDVRKDRHQIDEEVEESHPYFNLPSSSKSQYELICCDYYKC